MTTGATTEVVTCENSATVLCSKINFIRTAAVANKVAGSYCNSPKTGKPVECTAEATQNGDYACAVSLHSYFILKNS